MAAGDTRARGWSNRMTPHPWRAIAAAMNSVAARHPELSTVLRAAASGTHKPVYLLVGEPYETRAAAEALLEVLVPASRRTFNLETYDGRTTAVHLVLDSVRTPGFFPGLKVVWVRESTLFLSGEKRTDLTKGLFAAWSDGREADAADKLLTLIALAGWSEAEFRTTRWPAVPKTRVREVFGEALDDEQLAALAAVQNFCAARELTVGGYQDESGAVIALLDAGIPPHAVLLFSASTVDARKRIVKRIRDVGVVLELDVARERSGALGRQTVEGLIAELARDSGKRVAPAAHELIARRAGSDLAMFSGELEKLRLYVGDRPLIGVDDVEAVVRDLADSWIFDFTAALAARQVARVLPLLSGLMEQGEPVLRLVAMIAREIRLLLVARECLDAALRGAWRSGLSFNVFQSRVLPLLDDETRTAFGNVHPFVLYRRFQDAERMKAGALRIALIRLSELDVRLKSSRSDPKVLLEAFVLDWCRV